MRRRLLRLCVVAVVLGAISSGCSRGPSKPRPDVFVFVIDTVRRDVFSSFNPTFPGGGALDILASDAVVLAALYSPTSWTRTAVASLLTGTSPLRHGVLGRLDPLPSGHATLAEVLRGQGYATLGWSTNPNILPVWGFDRGFDSLVDVGRRHPKGRKPDAGEVLREVASVLEERSRDPEAAARPALYYVHLMDGHRPYQPADDQLARVVARSDELRPHFPAAESSGRAELLWRKQYPSYVAEVRAMESELGRLFDRLRELGRYHASLILVVSDHGEEFLDHGGITHGQTLFEEMLLVPAWLKLPGNVGAGTRIEQPIEMHDLMPTMLVVLGIEPPDGMEGSDVLAPDELAAARPRFADLTLDDRRLSAVTDEGWKLIVDHATGGAQLYHLDRDPLERNDLVESEPERVARLRVLLDWAGLRHAPGWHLRVCGCESPARIVLELADAGGVIERRRQEPEDRTIELEAGRIRAELMLTPIPLDREEGWRGRAGRYIADVDEFLLEDADGTTVFAVDEHGRAVEFALGRGERQQSEGPIELAPLVEDARVAASEPVDCVPPDVPRQRDECTPYVRIWYTSSHRVRPDAVDADVIDRLKALGYQW